MGEGACNVQRGVLFYNRYVMYICSEIDTDDATYRYVHRQCISNRLEANVNLVQKKN